MLYLWGEKSTIHIYPVGQRYTILHTHLTPFYSYQSDYKWVGGFIIIGFKIFCETFIRHAECNFSIVSDFFMVAQGSR